MKANEHIAQYVWGQLDRIRSNESPTVDADEFEAQLDGQ